MVTEGTEIEGMIEIGDMMIEGMIEIEEMIEGMMIEEMMIEEMMIEEMIEGMIGIEETKIVTNV